MRSLSFTATGAEVWNEWAALCCSCGLCSLYSCPEGLFPKTACDDSKATMRAAGLKWNGSTKIKVHPMRDGRRTPVKALSRKLNVVSYEHPAPLRAEPLCPKEVILPLKQSAGSPSIPTVKVGDEVTCGQSIAEPPPKALGSIIHAPFAATVTAVTAHQIILKRKS